MITHLLSHTLSVCLSVCAGLYGTFCLQPGGGDGRHRRWQGQPPCGRHKWASCRFSNQAVHNVRSLLDQNLSATLVSIGKAYGWLGSQPSASSISAISLMFKKGFQLVTTLHLFSIFTTNNTMSVPLDLRFHRASPNCWYLAPPCSLVERTPNKSVPIEP